MHLGKTTLAIALMLAGCGGSETGGQGTAGAHVTDGTCADETRDVPYSAGMSITGDQGVTVTLLDASPAPPRYGDNAWTLEVKNAAGEPMIGASITLKLTMVDHGHGPPVNAVVTDNQDGTYVATPVNFNMPGYWTTEVTVEGDGQATDHVTFGFCIE